MFVIGGKFVYFEPKIKSSLPIILRNILFLRVISSNLVPIFRHTKDSNLNFSLTVSETHGKQSYLVFFQLVFACHGNVRP